MIALDGRRLAKKVIGRLKKKIKKNNQPLKLAIIVVGSVPAMEKFVAQKLKVGEQLGVKVHVHRFNSNISGDSLSRQLRKIVKTADGVVVQLPLPKRINQEKILNLIPYSKDPELVPPVALAVKAFFNEYKISYSRKKIVIVGSGRLVGRAVADWLASEGISFIVVTENTSNPISVIKKADIIISGAGRPGLIKPNMVKKGAVVIDAGSPVGDVDPAVAKKAGYMTPVPGGVGPLTVAMLFKNLVELKKKHV